MGRSRYFGPLGEGTVFCGSPTEELKLSKSCQLSPSKRKSLALSVTSRLGRLCCKRPKTSGEHFLARRQSKSRPPIDMASGCLPKSPVSSSPWDEVPHMFTRKPRLRPAKFSNPGAKRLLQHNPFQSRHCVV